ncbi:hypothetical protein [Streptomyces sp. NPDC055243]|uniref:hypothetical protein n=1 Tax=Streptomyces sp. NPDC055243 TaxID=3365720 RepID=UPI0037CFA4CE
MPTLRAFAPYPPAGAAAYSTIVALQAAGMPERPAHALGAVALLVFLQLTAALIKAISPAAAPARH